jgi:hypothetical protein
LSAQVSGISTAPLQSNSANITVPNNGLIGFEAHFVAAESGTLTSTFIKVEGAVKNTGSAAIVGTITTFYVAEDTPGLHIINVSVSGTEVVFNFRNNGNTQAKGVCYVRYTQTFF